jgi:dGTPase
LETQVVDAADSIAYDTHDADDAVELGLVRMEDLLELPLVAEAAARVAARDGRLEAVELRHRVLHELVDMQVVGLIAHTRAALESASIDSVAAVRAACRGPDGRGTRRLVGHEPAVAAGKRQLEKFLFERVYRSERVLAVRVPAQRRLAGLFAWYCDHPDALPAGFRRRADEFGLRRSVADYIAGMTDRFLEHDHARRLGA